MRWNEIKTEKEKVATAVDLARAIVNATNEEGSEVTIKDATKVVKGIREGILALVASGYREIKVGNIAVIKIPVIDAYTAKNPKTGEEIAIPKKLRAVAKVSKTLKTMVSEFDINAGEDVLATILKEKAERSEKAKKIYADRVAKGNGFKKAEKA